MATHGEYEYLKLMVDILKNGRSKPTRGIHGIKSIFGAQIRFDMRQGFPLLTTKKMPFNLLLHEQLWFVSGSSSVEYLHEHKIHYWDGFLKKDTDAKDSDASESNLNRYGVDESNDLGRVYGVQWRHWRRPDGTEFDQLQWAIDEIKNNPNSKAIIVSAWNAGELEEMRLPPCHTMFQFDVTKGKLRLSLYQRSSDVFLGLPFNIAQYSMMLYMVAHLTGLEARELIISIGNGHLYNNHIEAAKEQLQRKPMPFPKLKIVGDVKDIDSFTADNFELTGYESHPRLKAPLVIL
jgi:thymidylate synthase